MNLVKKIAILFFFSIKLSVFSQSIELEIDSGYINLGDFATLTVTATGDIQNLDYTEPQNLSMVQIGKNSSISIINGKKSSNYIITFRIKPLTTGEISLPTFFTTTTKGEKIESKKLIIYVDDKISDNSVTTDATEVFESPYVKLYIDLPARNLYVGEAIPVKITAFFSTKYQPGIDRAPYIKFGSFLIDNGDSYKNLPEKSINGERWIPIQWDSHLTPLKTGKMDLQLLMESYIEIPTRNSGFFSTTSRETIKTTTKIKEVDILPIPMENRPESYSGAIGNFSIKSLISPKETIEGDPITINIDIFGEGNFQRVTIPQIIANENWKLYPETVNFNGSNSSNFKGVKNFQQIVIPMLSDINKSPEIIFSYFDPLDEKFVTLKTGKEDIKVSQNNNNPNISNEKQQSSKFSEYKEETRHKKSKTVDYTTPAFKRKYVIFIIIIDILLLLSLITVRLIKFISLKRDNSPKKLLNDILEEIKKKENENNFIDALFLYNKIIAINTQKKSINPESFTSDDIDNENLKKIIEEIESYKYSGKKISNEVYFDIASRLKKELIC